ncbi:MAG: histidine phosphatase family protein [Clostridia bacterium]|nr:histidine phosphatase family protein [Clostridia bacterium]
MKLILVRHGMTLAGEKHLYCGKTDLSLSARGVRQLQKRRGDLPPLDLAALRCVSSGMKRCEETLEIYFGALPHEIDPAFCEMDFGAFEMRSYAEMQNDPAYIAWISGDNEANIAPGGESGNRMRARVLSGLARLLADGRDTLLVTHGGVIAVLMAHLFPEENKNRYAWQPPPGGGYVVDLTAHAYTLLP